MLCGWEGNRRPGFALAMRHRLSGIYPPTGSMAWEREMSTPPKLSSGAWQFTVMHATPHPSAGHRYYVQTVATTWMLFT